MVRVQDLMVGDLLRVNRNVCIRKGAIVEVRGIDADNRLPENGLIGSASCVAVGDPDRMSGGVWLNYLDPIPLTPEILEKNGFVYCDLPFVQGWEQYGLTICDGYVYCGRNVSMEVKTVNQLQHLFKNCAINHIIKL